MSIVFRRALRFVRRHSGTRFGLAVQRIALAVYRESCNPGYSFAENGELRVIEALNAFERDITIFDVGANVGHWSSACIAQLGSRATVYAFEPANRSFNRLRSATQGLKNVHACQIGLSSSECEMDILVSDSIPEKASVEAASATALHAHISDFQGERQRFVRGDGFCEEHGIERINLLKIDTEGHDLKVLLGFERMLGQGRVDAIQFEYNRLNIFTKCMLHDFYSFLNETCTRDGYRIGRVYPRGVCFKQYSTHDENFVDGNFLAVRADLSELIARAGA